MPAASRPPLVLLATLAMVAPLGAQDAEPIRVPRIAEAPAIDGRLDDPAWAGAARLILPYEWYPGDNTPAPVATECLLVGDAAHLYVGCRASDPTPEAIRRYFADRDDTDGQDRITILLDPFGSRRRGFRFTATALGVQGDALYSEETGDDETWDATWRSAGRLTADGYVVEVAIPFLALRLPPSGDEQEWRAVIRRAYPRSAAHDLGSVRRDRSDNCLLCQATRLTGIGAEGASRRRAILLQPTLTATREEEELPTGGLDATTDVEVGVTGGWEVTPAIRLNATVNPDFSQVEADAAQFEVNRRFALAFDEKRQFFLDGQDYFDLPSDLVFTRTVVDPVAGLKLTGTAGRHAFGAFATLDRLNSIILPGSQSSERVSQEADVAGLVSRYRVDLPNASSAGLLAAGRRAEDYANGVVGMDGALRFGRSHRLRFVAAGSRTEDTPAVEALTGRTGSFGGVLWNLRYDLETRHWEVEAGHRGTSAGFRDDAGLVQRVDLTGPEAQLTRIFWGDEAGWFDRIALSVEGQRLTRFDGRVVDEKLELSARYDGPLQSELDVEHAWRREAFADRLFSRSVTEISAEIQPGDAVGLGADVEFGEEIDSDEARLADFVELGLRASLRLGRRVRADLRGRYQRLGVEAGRLFWALLADSKLEFHFDRRTFVRLIVQHREVRRDPARFTEPVAPRSNRLFAQLLFSYQVSPETVVFLGYAGTAEDFTGFDVGPQQRSLFLKVGYGLRP